MMVFWWKFSLIYLIDCMDGSTRAFDRSYLIDVDAIMNASDDISMLDHEKGSGNLVSADMTDPMGGPIHSLGHFILSDH